MTKYYVDDIKGHRIYEGFDEDTAYRLCRQYNENCGGTYEVDEFDFDEPVEISEHDYEFWRHDYLTSLYGSDEAIKDDMKMAIEYVSGKKIVDFELDYNDPGDSGDDATFWAHRIQWEGEPKRTKTYYIKIQGYCDTVLAVYKIEASSFVKALEIAKNKYLQELDFDSATKEEYHEFQEEDDEEEEE